MNFISSIQFWLMCTIMVRLLGEKLFCSFESVLELNRGLRDSQNSINNKDLGLRKEAENICKDNIWSSFLRVLALSSVICWPNHLFYASVGFQKCQKIFNQKIYPRERCDSNKCFVLLWTCLYKKQIIFHWITTLCSYWNYWCLQKINENENMDIVIEKKLKACVKSARGNG